MRKAIFIDKDGTLIRDVPYNVNPDLITLEFGAAEAVKRWRKQGFMIVVISNQSGVSRGYFKEDQLRQVSERLRLLMQQGGADIDDFYFCPHHPDGVVKDYAINCACRKPSPGLIIQAGNEWDIDLTQSWMIGDILNDVEAGYHAGCKTILIDRGNETEWIITPDRTPDFVALDLLEAVDIIEKSQLAQYES